MGNIGEKDIGTGALGGEVLRELQKRAKNGAYWFYFIAGFTLLGAISRITLHQPLFQLSLSATQFTDDLATTVAAKLTSVASFSTSAIAVAVDLLLAGLFASIGYFAARRSLAIYLVGLVLYTFDFFVPLVNEQWLAVVFHVVILVGIARGMTAVSKLRRIEGGVTPLEAAPELDPVRRKRDRRTSFALLVGGVLLLLAVALATSE